MPAIEARNLTKRFSNGVNALDGLNLHVEAGEIFTLLGPNGCGKSTLIHLLTTYHKPTSGEVRLFGHSLTREPGWVRANLACAAQRPSIDAHLSLTENMLFQSRLYRVDKAVALKRMESLIDSFQLSRYRDCPTAFFSGGVRRRLDIALALMSAPKLLLLDEPTAAMDAESRRSMWDMVRKVRDGLGTTVFLTTHYLEEAEQLSDTIGIMNHGKALMQGSPACLRGRFNQTLLRIVLPDSTTAAVCCEALNAAGLVRLARTQDRFVFAQAQDSAAALPGVFHWLSRQSFPFCGAQLTEPSLEDVFLTVTREGGAQS